MYTNIESMQILISLLKQYNIKNIVVSPGTRNTPFAHSVESDDFFNCYSIVDERSAGYFALGLAESTGEPACVSCTSATATCNYLPAIKEAYERHIPLVALTADQNNLSMFNMGDQNIDQHDMYHGYVKKAVDIPVVNDKKESVYCTRVINEALIEIYHGEDVGPVQINFHLDDFSLAMMSEFNVEELPKARKINYYNGISDAIADECKNYLKSRKKILIIGASANEDQLRHSLANFVKKFNCVALCDTYSNSINDECEYILKPLSVGEVINRNEFIELNPDLIISFGSVYYSQLKNSIRWRTINNCEHWEVVSDGMLNDGYHRLTKVFESDATAFFDVMSKDVDDVNDEIYFNMWKNQLNKIEISKLPFTHFSVIQEFCKNIPEGSIMHASVLDAIRLSSYVKMSGNIDCFANIGADGIDGALSTFLGQASNYNKLAYLLIGDLSFLYDLNALKNVISNNIRILVINNFAGAEFHRNFGVERIATLNNLVAAGHNVKIEQCIGLANVEYLHAYDEQSLEHALSKFNKPSNKPVLLEVFTDAQLDAKTLKTYWEDNKTPYDNV